MNTISWSCADLRGSLARHASLDLLIGSWLMPLEGTANGSG